MGLDIPAGRGGIYMENTEMKGMFSGEHNITGTGQKLNTPVFNYRDRLFRFIFRNKKSLLQLFNALQGTDYTDVSDLEITTLEDVVYMKMKNDVSFIMESVLNLYEHQSTWNPNMPLRNLFYLYRQYRDMVEDTVLYSSKRLFLPTPVCIVFYNGNEDIPDVMEQRLSDSYENTEVEPSLELKVRVYNINEGHNSALMEGCRKLKEYSIFVGKVKRYLLESKAYLSQNVIYKERLGYAIERAIDECIREGILKEILETQKKEVTEIMLTEYDEEAVLKMIGEERYEDGYTAGKENGKAEGKAETILYILSQNGMIPTDIEEKICSQRDLDVLNKCLEIALQVKSVEEFMNHTVVKNIL